MNAKNTVAHYIDSEDFGGAEQMVLTIVKHLDKNIWSPVLFYHPRVRKNMLADKVKELDIEVVPLPEIKSWRDISGALNFRKELKRLNAKIFHAHLPWNLSCSNNIISAFISKVPVVVTQHAYKTPRSRKVYYMQKLMSLFIDRYIAVSQGQAEQLERSIIDKKKLSVIYNGIDLQKFTEATSSGLRKQLDIDQTTPIIISVARMDELKGHEYLLKTAQIINEAVFVLVGDGPERSNFEKLAGELGVKDRVFFLGYRDDIPALLKCSDIYVHPSLIESLGLSVIEAMAADKPVAASDISGIREIIKNGETGLLVPPQNSEALANAIRKYISDKSFSEKLARAGQARVIKKFSAEEMLSETTKIYNRLLNPN